MKSIETKIIINATPDEVWTVLMDHQTFPEWNPFIKSLTGDAEVGGQLTASISSKDKEMQFTPAVLVNEQAREFRWLGHLFIKGLFDGEHFFKLNPINEQQTEFIHGENFSGMLSGVLLKMIEKDTKGGFQAMNEALKIRVESLQSNVA